MAQTISVPFTTLPDEDSITESWDSENGAQASVKFKCAWADRYQLVKDLVGTYVGTPPSSIVRVPPFRHPESPNLFCTAIERVQPQGSFIPWPRLGLPWMSRQNAIVTARFSVPHWDFSGPDAYTKITFGSSGEFLSVPETSMVFGDGTPTMTPVGILIPQMEITVERNRMPFLPVYAMTQCEGKVNSAPYMIGGFPFAAGFLLFASGESDYQIDATGNIAYSQQYKFVYRTVPWNWFLHPNGTGFKPITDLAGSPPYDSIDFSVLP